jgi:hypothetical protein
MAGNLNLKNQSPPGGTLRLNDVLLGQKKIVWSRIEGYLGLFWVRVECRGTISRHSG